MATHKSITLPVFTFHHSPIHTQQERLYSIYSSSLTHAKLTPTPLLTAHVVFPQLGVPFPIFTICLTPYPISKSQSDLLAQETGPGLGIAGALITH